MLEEDKRALRMLVAVYDYAKILEELADLANRKGDNRADKGSTKNEKMSQNYYHLAVSLEPAIKSAIERGL